MTPGSLFDLDPAAVACPYPQFEHMRSASPVIYVDAIEAFAVTRYDDITHIAKHPELFSSRMVTGPILARQLGGQVAAPVLLNADPPVHSRQRRLVNRGFTPRRVKEHEEAIALVATNLIDAFDTSGTVDLLPAFAVPLPLTIIAMLLGVPDGDMGSFKRWSDAFVVAIGNHDLTADDLKHMLLSQGEFAAYFQEQIDDRRRSPRDDLLTDVVQARIDDVALSDAEVLSMLSQFLVAGNETATKLIASAVLHLARHPEVAARLRAEPSGVAPFVEEVLRLYPPVQGLFRTATADCELAGVRIPAGAHLWLAYASGNRDADVFTDAGNCIADRQMTSPHLAFGAGEHCCIGASLARAEARIGLGALLARCDDIRLAIPEDELSYEPSYALHGLRSLPITVTPGGD